MNEWLNRMLGLGGVASVHHCEITRGARKSTRAQWNPTQSKGKSPPVVACSAFALHTRPTLSVHHAELKITGCRPAVLIEPRCSPIVPSHPATLQGQGVSTDAEGCTAPPVPARSHPGHHQPLERYAAASTSATTHSQAGWQAQEKGWQEERSRGRVSGDGAVGKCSACGLPL